MKEMRKGKRLLGILLACVMLIGLVPAVALAEVTQYPVYLGGTQVTPANKDNILGNGTASYDPVTKTLTLNNYDGSYIKANQALTIVLAEGTTNKITVPENTSAHGIYAIGDLKLTGGGDLSVSNENSYYDYRGIYAECFTSMVEKANVIVEMSGDLTVDSKTDGIQSDNNITLKGSGGITVTAGDDGIYSDGDITIDGSNKLTVNASGENGIYAFKDLTISDTYSGEIEINAASDKIDVDSRGIYATQGSIRIGGSGTLNGFIVLYDSSEMTINGGTINAEIDTDDNSKLTINGGTFNDEIDSHDSSTVIIHDGTFNEEVESRGSSTMVINGGTFNKDLNSRGSSTMTVNNGTFDLQADSCGESKMIIKGGTFKQITECIDESTMTIEGGTFSDDREGKAVALKLRDKGDLQIKGGTFLDSVVNEGEEGASLSITGGIFAQDPSALLGEGYAATKNVDGKFSVNWHVAIVVGDNSAWKKGSSQGLRFKSTGNFAEFEKVTVDGEILTRDTDYTAEAGSIIVTLHSSFLERLSVGQHKIVIVSGNDAPEATFTVNEANNNGGSAGVAGTIIINPSDNGGSAGGHNYADGNSGSDGGHNYVDANGDKKCDVCGNGRVLDAVPKTGEDGSAWLYGALLLLALVGIAAAVVIGKRRNA